MARFQKGNASSAAKKHAAGMRKIKKIKAGLRLLGRKK